MHMAARTHVAATGVIIRVTAVIDDVQDGSNNQNKSLEQKYSNACSLHLE